MKTNIRPLSKIDEPRRLAGVIRRTPPGAILMLLGVVCLAGCGRQVRVDGAWQNNVPQNQTFTRVLVVGVSPDAGVRCDFERFMATQIRSPSVTAIVSCNVMTTSEPLTLESIELAIAENQADAVLATTLVAAEVGAEDGGKGDTRGAGYYKATGFGYETPYYGGYYGGFGTYGIPVVYGEFRTAAPITTIDGEVDIVSRLWATRNATLVYEIDTRAKNLQSRDSALAAVTQPIAERLRSEGLIR